MKDIADEKAKASERFASTVAGAFSPPSSKLVIHSNLMYILALGRENRKILNTLRGDETGAEDNQQEHAQENSGLDETFGEAELPDDGRRGDDGWEDELEEDSITYAIRDILDAQ